jgi:pre-mRNA-splicing factor ISY1
MKRAEQFGDPKERRPFRTDDCTNLQEAEKWRRQVVKDISKKVSQIQNRKNSLLSFLKNI